MYASCRPSQFAEETKQADKVVPWGIVLTTALNGTFGLAYIISILFCIQVSLRDIFCTQRTRTCLPGGTNA